MLSAEQQSELVDSVMQVKNRSIFTIDADGTHLSLFPSIHEPSVNHHQGNKNQQRPLSCQPEMKRPAIDFDGQISGKKTGAKTGTKPNQQQSPFQTAVTLLEFFGWGVNFNHAEGCKEFFEGYPCPYVLVISVYPVATRWGLSSVLSREHQIFQNEINLNFLSIKISFIARHPILGGHGVSHFVDAFVCCNGLGSPIARSVSLQKL